MSSQTCNPVSNPSSETVTPKYSYRITPEAKATLKAETEFKVSAATLEGILTLLEKEILSVLLEDKGVAWVSLLTFVIIRIVTIIVSRS